MSEREQVHFRHTGDAYGWLGFWLALGMVLSTALAVSAYNGVADRRINFDCGSLDLYGGVCGGESATTSTTAR